MKARLPQGYGKQSQQQLMQKVQQMQENMRLKQEELENTEYSVCLLYTSQIAFKDFNFGAGIWGSP